ncbi:MAG: hypothetical protein V3S29_08715, partial [bacterium]
MRATTSSGAGAGNEEKPLEFSFDARNKSIVPTVFAMEAKRLKRFFARKPKVTLHQMEAVLAQNPREEELKKLIPGFVASNYLIDHAHQYLESLARLLLEAASKEVDDMDRQWFLLHQALDMATLAIQKSPKVINIPSQSITVSIYK